MDSKNKKILISLFSLTVLLFFLHGIATVFELYWSVWWIDIVNHLVGGAVVSMIGVLLWLNGKEKRPPKPLELLLFVLFVSIAWEVFEFSFGLMSFSEKGVKFDTSLDIVMDLLGILVARFLLRKHV